MSNVNTAVNIDYLMDTVFHADLRMKYIEQETSEGSWFLVSDSEQLHYFRCNKNVLNFINLFDGYKKLSEVLHEAKDNNDIESCCFNKDDVAPIMLKLLSTGVLYENRKEIGSKHWVTKLKQPMAIKVPLFNPEKLLVFLSIIGNVLLNKYFLIFYTALFFYSLSLIPVHSSDVSYHWDTRFFDPINIFCMFFIYPVLKAIHEIGHGLTLKHFGGDSKECGIIFLVLMPLPYINTSSSYLFTDKYQRVLVGLSGMLVELLLAMIAWVAWCHTDNAGMVSDILFDIAFIGSFSTLVFNLNPLMKFDGYYILSDILSIVNLNSRSRQLIGSVFAKHVLKLKKKTDFIAKYEYKWLFLYGVLAIPYRVFISLFIVFYLGSKFFIFGVLLAIWVVVQQIVLPLIRGFLDTYKVAKKEKRIGRFFTVILGSIGVCFVLGVGWKFQYNLSSSGVVLLNESQQLRAGQEGVITHIFVRHGDHIIAGQKVMRMENPSLLDKVSALKISIEELTARYDEVRAKDLLAAADLFDQRKGLLLELSEAEAQWKRLTIVADSEGVFVSPRLEDTQGSFVKKGAVVGMVHNQTPLVVTVIVDQIDIDKIRQQLSHISVVFITNPSVVYRGELLGIVPAASDQLPSRYLGSLDGGDIAVDGRDRSGTKAMRNNFAVQVEVIQESNVNYKSATAQLKFVFNESSFLNRCMSWFESNWSRNFNENY
ncbi:hypothetical protein [Neptunomonas japonica]|uniref:hypothetical protein n=1 Tax=Neptunomonas japonica TaxID=417574 RepID=UPI000420F993